KIFYKNGQETNPLIASYTAADIRTPRNNNAAAIGSMTAIVKTTSTLIIPRRVSTRRRLRRPRIKSWVAIRVRAPKQRAMFQSQNKDQAESVGSKVLCLPRWKGTAR